MKGSSSASQKKIVSTDKAPNGLFETCLDDSQLLLEKAKDEVENLLKTVLFGQIASNQHCYVNLPHPLSAVNNREAGVPCLSWGDERVARIEEVFGAVLALLGEDGAADLKRRANVIIREYKPRQHIPFHFDELECSELVIGIILLNEDGRGLCFRKGEGKETLSYCVKEKSGTVFSLRGESRYSWTHGLPPCPARRISITVRFFKQEVIDKWKIAIENQVPAIILTEKDDVSKSSTVRIMIVDGKSNTRKPVVVAATATDEDLIILFKNKLKIKPKTIEGRTGELLNDGDEIIGKK